MKKPTIVLMVFLLFVSVNQIFSQLSEDKLTLLHEYYSKALKDWNVPGMSIAIVSNDSILFMEGYGFTSIKSNQAVDDQTLFALASNTKAFTATALAMLENQQKLNWDDKVISYLPWFRMYDPFVTSEMNIRDLLSHRSGLKTFSGDLIWYGSTYSREEVIRKAAFLKPAHGFREQFGYSNIMYIAAGEIIPQITGYSWDEFVRNKILFPLNMNRSVLSVNELEGLTNVAQPHTYVNGNPVIIPWLNWDNMAPAGSLISSASDMANWLMMNLNQGIFGQDTLLNVESIYELQSPQTILPVTQASINRFPSTHFRAYGLGWSLMDYMGYKIVSHNGGYDGMISQTVLIPEARIGFVIMTNALSSLYYPLMYKTLDVLLDNPVQEDWNIEILHLVKKSEEYAQNEKMSIDSNRVAGTVQSLNTTAYAGYYGCSVYDSIQVYQHKGELMLKFMRSPTFIGTLKHWHYDTYELVFKELPSLPRGFVTFTIDRNGKPSEMEIYLNNPDFDFREFDLKRLD
ncbi:MAG: serine hydrolase [Bacteroidales bacterium]|nr:serine hydrolase [Bacteroidales bacterium]